MTSGLVSPLVSIFVDCFSARVCLLFSSWYGGDCGFGMGDRRGESPARQSHQRPPSSGLCLWLLSLLLCSHGQPLSLVSVPAHVSLTGRLTCHGPREEPSPRSCSSILQRFFFFFSQIREKPHIPGKWSLTFFLGGTRGGGLPFNPVNTLAGTPLVYLKNSPANLGWLQSSPKFSSTRFRVLHVTFKFRIHSDKFLCKM